MSSTGEDLPIVCTLSEADQAARQQGDVARLFARVERTRELDDGYEVTLPGNAETARAIAEFVIKERECCRFFTFDTTFEADGGPIRLSLRGPAGTKEFLEEGGLRAT